MTNINYRDYLNEKTGHLELQDQQLHDEDLKALCQFIKKTPTVRSVNLSATDGEMSNIITAKGCKELATLKDSSLIALHLSGNTIGNEGLKHLAKLDQLTLLDVKDTGIDETGLLTIRGLNNLISLDVSGNDLGVFGLSILTTSHPNLRILSIQNCKLYDDQVKALTELSHLIILNMSDNHLTDEAAKDLTKLQSLCFLDISRNHFSTDGIGIIHDMNFSNIDAAIEKQFMDATSDIIQKLARAGSSNVRFFQQHEIKPEPTNVSPLHPAPKPGK